MIRRRRPVRRFALLSSLVLLALGVPESGVVGQAGPGSLLYGRVTTIDGDVLEGVLRWGESEGSWADVLVGSKALPEEHVAEAARLGVRTAEDRERSIVYAGVRIVWEEDDDYPATAEAGVRFGHLATLLPGEDGVVRLELKSGASVDLRLSPGPGSDVRALDVVAPDGAVTEVLWTDIDRVDVGPAPVRGAGRPVDGRLHGTVHDRRGRSFTGFVAWDRDEAFPDDVLDGEDEAGDAREIRFREIAAIERVDRQSARVTLADGRALVLSGTNDVDRDNRGIEVTDPSLGQLIVPWGGFARFEAHPSATDVGYEAFDGGRRLRGTVTTRTGESHHGRIRWDNDEAWSWEMLDGRSDGVEMSIEMGLVRRIERVARGSVRVVLRDGRSFELGDSNDVDEGNKGIFVERDDGSRVGVRWDDFETLELEAGR